MFVTLLKKRLFRYLGTACEIILAQLFRPISYLIPRNKNLWVFGAGDGQGFCDNSKHLYLYVKSKHPEIRAVWLSKNSRVIREINDYGYEAYGTQSLKGFLCSLKAGYAILSCSLLDVNLVAGIGAKKIQLWHGIPLKHIGQDIKWFDSMYYKKAGLLSRLAINSAQWNNMFLEQTVDYLLACSKEHQQKMALSFKKETEKIFIAGYPRNDALFHPQSSWPKDNEFLANIRREHKCKRVFIYLPTFRDEVVGNLDIFTKYGFSSVDMQRMLEKLEAVLIIKAHRLDGQTKQSDPSTSSRIIFPSSGELDDVYPVLSNVDVLITDYSSVYFDFLLIDRPVIFAAFDLKEYISNDRQLYYDYDEVTPGPKAKNWGELIQLLEEETIQDHWKTQREEVRQRFHQYFDDNSSKRVFDFIRSIKVTKKK